MENQLYDLGILRQMTGGDKEFMKHMIQVFLEEAPIQISEIKKAFLDNNTAVVSAVAHKLKSSCKSMGVVKGSDLALEIEKNSKELNYSGELEEKIAYFEAYLLEVVDELKKELK